MPDTSPPRSPRNTPDLPALPVQPGEAKQAWVHRQIASAIAARLLLPGQPVPSTRALAARWRVSRGVVELAFERLAQEGYLQATVGRGTRVSETLPEGYLQAAPMFTAAAATPPENNTADPDPMAPAVRAGKPFVARLPDTAAFDLKPWRASVARAAQALEPAMLHAPDPRGLPALREEICRHLALSRGVACTPGQVLIVTGIRHAIDLCAQAMASSRMAVAIEDPGYPGAAELFALRGCPTVPVPVDTEGIDVDALRRSTARVTYVTPAHQAPTGVALSLRRRADLLQWASERDATLIEDDYDSDFSYETAPLPALKSQDHAGRVIFCGSFNKSLFPALRIGYIVAPPAHLDTLTRLRAATGRANSVLDQLALTDFMRTGAFTRHLKRARLRHQHRRDLVLAELRTAGLDDDLCQGLHAGFHFVLRLPEGITEDTAIARAAEQGIGLQGLRAFWHGAQPPPKPALVIGYTALTDAQARWHARQLARALTQLQEECH